MITHLGRISHFYFRSFSIKIDRRDGLKLARFEGAALDPSGIEKIYAFRSEGMEGSRIH